MTKEKNKEKPVNKFQAPGRTKVINGSILAPETAGLRFVLSVNNMAGKPENPLFPIFDKKWKKVKEESRGWFATKTGAYKLGAINTTAVQSDVWVIHMLCQTWEEKEKKLNTDVAALEECLKKVAASAKYEKSSVHVSTVLTDAIPELQELLTEHLVQQGVSVYFYKEPA